MHHEVHLNLTAGVSKVKVTSLRYPVTQVLKSGGMSAGKTLRDLKWASEVVFSLLFYHWDL